MKRIFQRRIDPGNGDCMQCAIASIFDLDYEKTPDFINAGQGWFKMLYEFLQSKGYDYQGMIHNKRYQYLITPKDYCFRQVKFHRPSQITKKALYNEAGVNGLFFASVLSPKYFTWENGAHHTTHAVVIDKDYNILHDPNPEYSNLIQYPLADIIGFNGIIDIYLINPSNA